ncbi:putative C6 transcription factor [Emericellopsis atlantica]|uniref:C6 transcription factor n=1 Tax=Emericellopsis atlantica TaxID=2614577 RepID=A0A9P8CSJ2_9HYPO|nr:putative C6 transcription factor [Emericellopsis atlantica]KAG9255811.1 putative C6 transcription factor [Emericellopsis atlantica]
MVPCAHAPPVVPMPERQTDPTLSTPTDTSPSTNTTISQSGPSRVSDAEPSEKAHSKAPVRVARACDRCKARRQKCDDWNPCKRCINACVPCLYETAYLRGRAPPLPPKRPADSLVDPEHSKFPRRAPATFVSTEARDGRQSGVWASSEAHDETIPPSRASPELEIEGQFHDPTSNLNFLHRAWKRLSNRHIDNVTSEEGKAVISRQPLMSAGDRPFDVLSTSHGHIFPDRETALRLFDFYFEQCVVTYRCLNRQYCSMWLNTVIENQESQLPISNGIGHAKAALVTTIMAIATLRQEKLSQTAVSINLDGSIHGSDYHFCAASALTNAETGLPRLESVQARVLQVLYLLQTGRMNQAWYVFGGTVPIVSALGLHRKSRAASNRSTPGNYIISQCRKRTFWTVYIIDKYLAVVFGRPRLYHDDDIDQEFPDRVNDEDMSPQGPLNSEPTMDCHIDSLVFHAKIAKIIDNISREVYSLHRLPKPARLASARAFGQKLYAWREELPPHLGTIRPLSLIPSFRRQAMALKLAYAHALMHANRPFLMGVDRTEEEEESTTVCINAAKLALETVDSIVGDTIMFHAFWWTPYVTFCALAVVYVWEIQKGASNADNPSLFALAERCQGHLAASTVTDSPSQRYSVILEELRQEARQGLAHQHQLTDNASMAAMAQSEPNQLQMDFGIFPSGPIPEANPLGLPLNEWQATDWLDLDSSAFGPFLEMDGSPIMWMGDVGQQ